LKVREFAGQEYFQHLRIRGFGEVDAETASVARRRSSSVTEAQRRSVAILESIRRS
jgi:hypothetical protein